MRRGAAIADQNFAYFTPLNFNKVFRYDLNEDKWEGLPPCPYRDSGLVVIDSVLTAVGGWDERYQYTKKLFALRQNRWSEDFRIMKAARHSPAVVTTSDGSHLIVAGGYGDEGWMMVVEVLNTCSRHWSTLPRLPQPLPSPSATIAGNQLHVIGRDSSGYTYCLENLHAHTCFSFENKPTRLRSLSTPLVQMSSAAQIAVDNSPTQSLPVPAVLSWTPLPLLPVWGSTAATLCGQLVSIGGYQQKSSDKAVHQLVDGQWMKIGCMASARHASLVVALSPDKVVVVGGCHDSPSSAFTVLDSVEVLEAEHSVI